MTTSGKLSAAAAADPSPAPAPEPASPPRQGSVDLDILKTLLSYYIRSINLSVSRDLDRAMGELPVARGTGKISTLLLVDANPGIRPSTIAEVIGKDRSAMGRLLDTLKGAGLIIQRVSERERRSHELYLTNKGQALAARVRQIAAEQDRRYFSVLSDEEQDQLKALLKRLYRHHIGGPVDLT